MDLSRRNRVRLAATVATFAATLSALAGQLAAKEAAHIEVRIVADDICCQGCAQKVAAQLYAAPGVTDVQTDVPQRLVKITAKPSAKLTLERLWRAVEKGKGAPSKLITPQATYTLTNVEQVRPSKRLPAGRYVLKVAKPQPQHTADFHPIIESLRSMPGVEHVDLDMSQHTITIQSSSNQPLSEWALVRVVKQAGSVPVRVSGPFGSLAIEYALERAERNAAK
ncbi:MAG TPA: heavy metal-associated domain-containing protein [Lacipirellulaceae bacterium]